MDEDELGRRIHDLDVTLWVGKGGIGSVVDELSDQLGERELVKVKFLRAARTGTSTEEAAAKLAEGAGGDVVQTRGHTAVIRR